MTDAVRVIGHDHTLIDELRIATLSTIGLEASKLVERLIAKVRAACQRRPVPDVPALHAKVFVRGSA